MLASHASCRSQARPLEVLMPAIHVSPKDSEYGCSRRRQFWRCGCMRVSGIPSPRGVAATAQHVASRHRIAFVDATTTWAPSAYIYNTVGVHMMRRLTLGLRHSPIYYITFVLIYNIIPARIAPRARGHGTARARLAGSGCGSISAQERGPRAPGLTQRTT